MELSLLLMADYATVDASGKLNILGAFNILNVRQFPVRHPLMHLVMKFQPHSGEYGDTRKLRVTLVDEDGNEIVQLSSDVKIPDLKGGQIPELPAIIGFRDLQFEQPGHYEFRIFIDKDQKGDITLVVNHIDQPQDE